MQIEMRQAIADDVNFLWEVFRYSMKEYITRARGDWNEEREESQFRAQLVLSASQIISIDDRKIGFITMPTRDGAVWIHTICVAPEHQRNGIGTAVIRKVIAHARKEEMPVYLSVLKVNPARHLYERLGFRVTEESKHHYHMQLQGKSD